MFLLLLVAAVSGGCDRDKGDGMYKITISDIEGDVSGVTAVRVNFDLVRSYTYPFDASGMSFKFPAEVTVAQLTPMSNFFGDLVSDPEAMWGGLYFHAYCGDTPVGYLQEEVSDDEYRSIVQYSYVDRDVTITGSVREKERGCDVDLKLRKGWNRHVVRIPQSSGRPRIDIYTSRIPKGMEWKFARHTPNP